MSAERLVEAFATRGWTVAFAESCTGGSIAAQLTEIPGSSQVFECSVVSYSDRIKQTMLGVSERLLTASGAVSQPCVEAMLNGISTLSHATCCAAVTGIAGPGGGSPEKPVGTVWIGLSHGKAQWSRRFHFSGGRNAVRRATCDEVFAGLLRLGGDVEPW